MPSGKKPLRRLSGTKPLRASVPEQHMFAHRIINQSVGSFLLVCGAKACLSAPERRDN